MPPYSIEQKVWTVIFYARHGSPKKVQSEYRKKFGRNAKAPSNRMIAVWWEKFQETGSVSRKKRTNTKLVVLFDSFFRLLFHHFHPYKMALRQQILPQHQAARVIHAQNELRALEQDEHRMNRMIFSDESHFHLSGAVNGHTFRYWSDENPHWFREAPLHSPRG